MPEGIDLISRNTLTARKLRFRLGNRCGLFCPKRYIADPVAKSEEISRKFLLPLKRKLAGGGDSLFHNLSHGPNVARYTWAENSRKPRLGPPPPHRRIAGGIGLRYILFP